MEFSLTIQELSAALQAIPEELPPYWDSVTILAAYVLTWIGGIASVPAINWVKELIGWEGRKVYILVGIFSVLIAILGMIVDGLIRPGGIDYQNAGWLIVSAATVSKMEYDRIKGSLDSGEIQS